MSEPALADHLTYMRRRNLAASTIDRRREMLTTLRWWVEPGTLLDAKQSTVEAFIDSRDVEARTRYTYISHLSCFYRWAVREGLIEQDPTACIDRPKLRRLLPRPISDGDLAMALEGADRTMRAWLTLASYGGLRAAEVAGLRVDGVMLADERLWILGKGDKERFVPLHPLARVALLDHGLPRTGFVFRRPRGSRVPASMVSREANLYLQGLGIGATFHQCRHWFGTMTYRACRDLRVVQELLGHADPGTSAGYAAISNNEAQAAVAALPLVGHGAVSGGEPGMAPDADRTVS